MKFHQDIFRRLSLFSFKLFRRHIVLNVHQDVPYTYLVIGRTKRALETYQKDGIPKTSKGSNYPWLCHTFSAEHTLLLSFTIIFQWVTSFGVYKIVEKQSKGRTQKTKKGPFQYETPRLNLLNFNVVFEKSNLFIARKRIALQGAIVDFIRGCKSDKIIGA